jgi:hypothetical protein
VRERDLSEREGASEEEEEKSRLGLEGEERVA